MMVDIETYYGPGTVYVENPTDLETIYDWDLSYRKGAWVLHMLRHTVADSIFFEIIKTYASSSSHKYDTATTEEFQAICEQVSAMDLQKFFQQWIYGEYYPNYSYAWNTEPNGYGYKINLSINQIQKNTGLFWMPIDIKVTTSGYDTVFVLWDSLQHQTFEFLIDHEVLNIELDPDNWILKKSAISNLSGNYEYVPLEFSLKQNYPNPFNPTTTISYQLPISSDVELRIYDLLGQKVTTLVNKKQDAGNYKVEFDAGKLSSGLYFYKFETSQGFVRTKKLVVLK